VNDSSGSADTLTERGEVNQGNTAPTARAFQTRMTKIELQEVPRDASSGIS